MGKKINLRDIFANKVQKKQTLNNNNNNNTERQMRIKNTAVEPIFQEEKI
jgi:hypothetical protein